MLTMPGRAGKRRNPVSFVSVSDLPTISGQAFHYTVSTQLTTVTLMEKSRLGAKHWG